MASHAAHRRNTFSFIMQASRLNFRRTVAIMRTSMYAIASTSVQRRTSKAAQFTLLC
jgi:hypothetical protein